MSETEAAAAVLRRGAGVLALPERLSIRVEGEDRARFLNGMLSSDVVRLEVGAWQSAVKASAKGRVEGMIRVRREAEVYWLDLVEASAGRVAGELVKYVVMDDVRLSDGSSGREVVGLWGPEAPGVLERLGLPLPEDGRFASNSELTVLRDDAYGVPGYEIHQAPGMGWARFVDAGATPIEPAELDVLRVEAGVPKDGVDVDLDTIPLEANLDHAIDLKKGCYIGQEVIARATHRGGVRHRLVGLRFGAAVPEVGAALFGPGAEKATGEVTSVVNSGRFGEIGLGYVRVEMMEPGTKLEVGPARSEAVVAALPFVDI